MSLLVSLRDVAHCRAGDKGDTSILSVFPFADEDYPWLVAQLTVERVRDQLRAELLGEIERYELPNVCGLQFTCQQALTGGVTTSLALDTHGKSLSTRLLGIVLSRH